MSKKIAQPLDLNLEGLDDGNRLHSISSSNIQGGTLGVDISYSHRATSFNHRVLLATPPKDRKFKLRLNRERLDKRLDPRKPLGLKRPKDVNIVKNDIDLQEHKAKSLERPRPRLNLQALDKIRIQN